MVRVLLPRSTVRRCICDMGGRAGAMPLSDVLQRQPAGDYACGSVDRRRQGGYGCSSPTSQL